MITVRVKCSQPYEIIIGRGLLARLGEECVQSLPNAKKILVVSDSNVSALYLKCVRNSLINSGFDVFTMEFPAGEASKNFSLFQFIVERTAKLGFCRDDAFLALGGGVTGDITGFASACYMRGIRYVQVPTSLLSGIDASIGGKTAIDLPQGKNLVGAFHQPQAVYFDIDVLSTLPEKEWRNGLGEGIKYGILRGGKIVEILRNGLDEGNIEEFCALCAEYKAEIVAQDEKEGGLRQLLNLGHTIGHAEELLSKYTFSHGESVANGICRMAKASLKNGNLAQTDFEIIMEMLEKNNFKQKTAFPTSALLDSIIRDKKNHNDGINIIIIDGIGDCKIKKMSISEFGEYIK